MSDAEAPKAHCPLHGSPLPPACGQCVTYMGRPVEEMSPAERADELQHWFGMVLTVGFPAFHKRVEELVGRPVWTHEFATPEHLIEEAKTQRHPVDLEAHVIGSLDQLAGNKPVVIVRTEQ